ncbi:macrophage mannose receptor 1-like protein [Lates japonicus]|uniref:Macrophage mannose receptor 1-like protein n=1 Tax=Lates japonicus TaxID=270547 RepID=A0AAD3MPL1_LATJO|nr:macrophage mannose receptor 1-like protein [Lates japonicus]
MQWSLFQLILIGSFLTCQLYEYHFIKQEMAWKDAQNFCKGKYTDLATVYNMSDVKKLKTIWNFHDSANIQDEAWIGLYSQTTDKWIWSDGSQSSFRYWHNVDNHPVNNKCVVSMWKQGKWKNDNCNNTNPFFCYDNEVILIKESKTWEEALNYCRENYSDLVSITNPHQQRWVQRRAKKASTPFVWSGLRYTCTLDLWFWVNDQLVCYDTVG